MPVVKQWTCKHNHILGFVRWNGDNIPQLMVLRQSLDMAEAQPDEVDLLGPLTGNMPVRCSVCGDVKPWKISVDGLVALFETLDDQDVLEFSQKLLKAGGGG